MSKAPSDYPPQYTEGIRLFNAEEFFECHDVLEELWTETHGEERRFLQGLIQAAVALFHFSNGNLGGARKMYRAAVEKLTPYAPRYWDLDVERFLRDFRHCFDELLQPTDVYPTGVTLHPERIPVLFFGSEAQNE